MLEFDWKLISREFVRALRGRVTQLGASRRMGFRGNPVRTWEAGTRFPTHLQTMQLAQVSDIDPVACFAQFHPPTALTTKPSKDSLAQWMSAQRGSTSIRNLSGFSGMSRFSVSRTLKGETVPRLPEFLALVHAMTARVDDLLSTFVDIESIPSLVELNRRRVAQRNLTLNEPWTEAILRLLEIDSIGDKPYVPGILAEALGIETEVEELCVERMVIAGVVSRCGDRLEINPGVTVYTGHEPSRVRVLKKHWAKVAMARIESPKPGDRFAYNLMTLSEADYERVQRVLEDSYREVRSIVAASDKDEVAALVQFQCLRF